MNFIDSMASFWKTEACGQTVLPDRSLLLGQKLVDIYFSNIVTSCSLMKLDQHYRILYWHNPRGYLDTTLRVLQICILYREVSMIELNFHAKIFSLDGIISYYITVKDVTCRERLLRNRNGISWNHRHRHYCRIRRRNNKWNNVYGDRHSKYLE